MAPVTAWGSVLGDRHSVRWRVTLGASLLLGLALTVTTLAAAGLMRRALTADEDAVLTDRADEVTDLIDTGLLSPVLESAGQQVGQVEVIDAAGRIVARTPDISVTIRLDVVDAPPVGRQRVFTVDGASVAGATGVQYRILARTVESESGPLTIYVASRNSAALRAQRYLHNSMLFVLPIFLLLTGWLISRLVKRALAPVEAMRVEVDRIEANQLSTRVDPGVTDDEITKLGNTLNRMLDRLEQAAARQELFAASASHELRSPLSAIRTELEVGLAYPEQADWPTIARDSLIDVERLEELSRSLRTLTRSRSAVATVARPFDLAELVASEVARRRPVHPIRLGALRVTATIVADRDGVVQVVRNLLDNADRHARSEVWAEVIPDAMGVTLVVSNDGRPIPAGMHQRIFDAFTRLDEARSLDAGGSGLGLAIARTVMEVNGGTLVAAEVERGAAFRAWFPSPAA